MARSIRVDFTQFKSAGVYTLEFSAGESVVINTQTTRLVIGFSRKGPFNAPVYLTSGKQARDVFGDIDPFLERQGAFFHRSLFTCLTTGPVFALNLMPLNNDVNTGDRVQFTAFSLATTESNVVEPQTRLLSSFFNTQRFWKLDQANLLANANLSGSPATGKLLNIVNISQNPVSILVRKAAPATVAQYQVTAKEWYGVGNVPAYVDENDYISDYFVTVTILQGDFTNYQRLATDPVFSEYFTNQGLRRERLRDFIGSNNVIGIGEFTGSVIPDFADSNGNNRGIDTVMNASVSTTGVFVALNRDAFESYDPAALINDFDTASGVDMVGHNLADPTRVKPEIINFLGYRAAINEAIDYELPSGFTLLGGANGFEFNTSDVPVPVSQKRGQESGVLSNTIRVKRPTTSATQLTTDEWTNLFVSLKTSESLVRLTDGTLDMWGTVQTKSFVTDESGTEFLEIGYSHPVKAAENTFKPLPFSIRIASKNTNTTAVKVAAASNVAVGSNAPATLDGVTLVNGDLVLLTGQTNTVQNGVYLFTNTTGPFTRTAISGSTWFQTTSDLTLGSKVTVSAGTHLGKTFYVSKSATVGTDTITFTEDLASIAPELVFLKASCPSVYKTPTDLFAQAGWWQPAGEQILLENRTRKFFRYVTVGATHIESTRAIVQLTAADIAAVTEIDAFTAIGFGATVHSEARVKYNTVGSSKFVDIVISPDAGGWVPAKGTRTGFQVRGTGTIRTNTGSNAVVIAIPNSETASSLGIPSAPSNTIRTAVIGIQSPSTGAKVFLHLRAGVALTEGANDSAGTGLKTLTIPVENSIPFADVALIPAAELTANSIVASWGFESTPSYVFAHKSSKLYNYYLQGILNQGDRVFFSLPGTAFANKSYFMNWVEDTDADGVRVLKGYFQDTFNAATQKFTQLPSRGLESGIFGSISNQFTKAGTAVSLVDGNLLKVYGGSKSLSETIPYTAIDSTKTRVVVGAAYDLSIAVGDYIVALTRDAQGQSQYRLTKVIAKRRIADGTEFTTILPIWTSGMNLVKFSPIDDFVSTYQFAALSGFKLTDYHLPSSKNRTAQLSKILGVLDPSNSNLMSALSSKDVIAFRYIIDTFDGTIAPGGGPKAVYAQLAQARGKALAFINMPSIDEFAASTDPRFTDEPTATNPAPTVAAKYIATGGNLALGPQTTYSLVGETQGSKYCGYFGPYLLIRENGKIIKYPPAAVVSNNYIRKFITGNPYAAIAGNKRGVISEPNLGGLEIEFLQSDRDYLEPMGVNTIIKKQGLGYVIYGNSTGYQNLISPLNDLHVRDILISITDGIEQLLENYVFDFNDTYTRNEIKSLVDTFLESVRSAGGIEDYYTIMDSSNNTGDVIAQGVGVIEVGVTPTGVMRKLVTQLTVNGRGGVQSEGF
jgi:hypothetical protein